MTPLIQPIITPTINVGKYLLDYLTGGLPIDTVKKRLYDNIYPASYYNAPIRFRNAVVNNKRDDIKQWADYTNRDPIFAKYLQIPDNELHSGIKPLLQSDYKPTIGNNANTIYYKDPGLSKGNVDGLIGESKRKNRYGGPLKFNESKLSRASDTLGTFTISRGNDPERGEYVSYYDLWDLSPFGGAGGKDLSFGIGTPVNIYDRIYLDDYYGVDSKPNSGDYYGGYLPEVKVHPKNKKKLKKFDLGKQPTYDGGLLEDVVVTGKKRPLATSLSIPEIKPLFKGIPERATYMNPVQGVSITPQNTNPLLRGILPLDFRAYDPNFTYDLGWLDEVTVTGKRKKLNLIYNDDADIIEASGINLGPIDYYSPEEPELVLKVSEIPVDLPPNTTPLQLPNLKNKFTDPKELRRDPSVYNFYTKDFEQRFNLNEPNLIDVLSEYYRPNVYLKDLGINTGGRYSPIDRINGEIINKPNITINSKYNTKEQQRLSFLHEMRHHMDHVRPLSRESRQKLYDAYDLEGRKGYKNIDHEYPTTNTEYRYRISRNNGDVYGELLNSVINNMSDYDILEGAINLNGYTGGMEKYNKLLEKSKNGTLSDREKRKLSEKAAAIRKALIEVAQNNSNVYNYNNYFA